MKKTKEKILGLGFVFAMVISVLLFASVVHVASENLPGPPGGTEPCPGVDPTKACIKLTANPTTISAGETSVINASVWDDGGGWILFGVAVNFSTDFGEITTSAPVENETATAILTTGSEQGNVTATVMAEVNLSGNRTANIITVNLTTSGDGGNGNGDNGGDGNGNGGNGGGNGGDGGATTPTPTPTAGETPTPTPTPTAGATATPTVSPTASPAETGTPTATPSPGPTKKPLIPGFETVFAIASLFSVAYLVLRRREGSSGKTKDFFGGGKLLLSPYYLFLTTDITQISTRNRRVRK